MWQTAIVGLLVAAAAAWVGRGLWRGLSGRGQACGCGEGQAQEACDCCAQASREPQGLEELTATVCRRPPAAAQTLGKPGETK